MISIINQTKSNYKVKGSKFIGYFCPCKSLDDIEKTLIEIKSEHPTATHHCYAYRINPEKTVEFAQDDGEPSGTAGVPILNALKSAEAVNTLLVVVRYYGGTNLGKGGLISAYKTTAELAIEKAELKSIVPVFTYRLEYKYDQQSDIDQIKHSVNWSELDAIYTDTVVLKIACHTDKHSAFKSMISSIEHQLIDLEFLKKTYFVL